MRSAALTISAAALAVNLSGCASLGSDAELRKRAEQWHVVPEIQLQEARIRWVRVTQSDLNHAAEAMMGSPQAKLYGLSIPPIPGDDRCLVFAPEPKRHGDGAMDVLAHEVLHCYTGRWHVPSSDPMLMSASREGQAAEMDAVWGDATLPEIRAYALEHIDEWFPAQAEEVRAFFTAD